MCKKCCRVFDKFSREGAGSSYSLGCEGTAFVVWWWMRSVNNYIHHCKELRQDHIHHCKGLKRVTYTTARNGIQTIDDMGMQVKLVDESQG